MKKSMKIILLLLLIGIFTSVHFLQVEAAYQVTVGQTFDYDVIKASIAVTVNGVSGSGAGYTNDSHQFGENTLIMITVDTVDPSYVDWTVSADGYSETSSSTGFDLLALAILLIYPIFATALSPGDTSQGLGVIILPFWGDYFDAFEDIADPSAISELTTEPRWEGITIQAKYDDSDSDVIFDWYMTGTMDTTTGTESLNINIDHNLKIVFEKSTGVMNGLLSRWNSYGRFL